MNATEFEELHTRLMRVLSDVEDALSELECEPHEVDTDAIAAYLDEAADDLDDAREALP
jgi:Mg2+ and Co2+ transporter CorA